jgi:hypothetical protein
MVRPLQHVGARRQGGTLLITTSPQKRGYLAAENTYDAPPGDAAAMRAGLAEHKGQRSTPRADSRWI